MLRTLSEASTGFLATNAASIVAGYEPEIPEELK